MEMSPNLPFSRAFDFASEAVAERFQNPFWKLKEFFVGSRVRAAIKEVKQFGRSIVSVAALQRAKRGVTACQEKFIGEFSGSKLNKEATSSPIKESENLINFLLDHIDDQQIVADAAMNYLSAGLSSLPFPFSPPSPSPLLFHLYLPPTDPKHNLLTNPTPPLANVGRDTTAQSLTWTFYLLMRHPSTTAKILAELLPLPNRTVELLLPSSLPYTNAVFYESLRLYPPVPIEIKETSQCTTLPDGTVLPTGAIVMYIPWAMNRCFQLWGETAHDFLPDRWLSSLSSSSSSPSSDADAYDDDDDDDGNHQNHKMIFNNKKSAYEFPVFNAGPRTCLGKKFAEALAIAVLVALVPKYDFTLLQVGPPFAATGATERKSRNSLTLPMDGGLPCLVRRRTGGAGEID